MHCVGLETQKGLRDLIQLPKLVEEVRWKAVDEVDNLSSLVVMCGLWLYEERETASKILLSRSEKGFPTLIVPRFTAGNLGTLLRAPADIEVESADFDSLEWKDGSQHHVSGVTYLNTSLPSGNMGKIGLGPVVFSYRPSITAGPIVICTAALTGRPSGVKLASQQRLFAQIINEIELKPQVKEKQDSLDQEGPAQNLDEFLLKMGGQGASFLLLYVAADGDRSTIEQIASKVGVEITTQDIKEFLRKLPVSSTAEIKSVLSKHGWGAYLRRIQHFQSDGETQ